MLYEVITLWYQFIPEVRIIMLPLFILIAFAASMAGGLWIAALNVKYRDFRYIIPFIVQFGLYISPVGFTSSIVPDKWRLLYSLNPMVGVIDGFRWAILGGDYQLYFRITSYNVCYTKLLRFEREIACFMTGIHYWIKRMSCERSKRVISYYNSMSNCI